MLTSRERVELALNHREPDRVPLDLGATVVSGMHVSSVYLLRQALGLDEPGTPVKVVEPYQMLGKIKEDLIESLEIDTVALSGTGTLFGFKNEGWKPWTFHDGTRLLVPEKFNTEAEPNGDILMYPQDDKSVPPSGRMPAGGWYFDAIIRQPPIGDESPNFEDNLEEFEQLSDEELEHFGRESERLFTGTDKALVLNFGGASFGDVASLSVPWLKHPRGIRDIEEWYISTVTRPDYIYRVFEGQCEIALANLKRTYEAVGNRVTVIIVTGTDFGGQNRPLVSPKTYRELYEPFFRCLNDWIHQNTEWKTMMHTDGAVRLLIDDFISSGFDILNPLQTSATGMNPVEIKRDYGNQLVFWGGGIDTQKTLPFGSSDDVRQEVQERIEVLGPGGGFVFNSIHNIQPCTPIENILALYGAFRENRHYHGTDTRVQDSTER
jgi:hypothetical protein